MILFDRKIDIISIFYFKKIYIYIFFSKEKLKNYDNDNIKVKEKQEIIWIFKNYSLYCKNN